MVQGYHGQLEASHRAHMKERLLAIEGGSCLPGKLGVKDVKERRGSTERERCEEARLKGFEEGDTGSNREREVQVPRQAERCDVGGS